MVTFLGAFCGSLLGIMFGVTMFIFGWERAQAAAEAPATPKPEVTVKIPRPGKPAERRHPRRRSYEQVTKILPRA